MDQSTPKPAFEQQPQTQPNPQPEAATAIPQEPRASLAWSLSVFAALFGAFLAAIFALRLGFAMAFSHFLHGAALGAIVAALLKGLRFDAAAASFLLLPALPVYMLGLARAPRPCRRLLRVYLALAFVAVMACALGDMQYFEESGKHLTYEALGYLDRTSLPVYAGALKLHPWITILSLLATALAGGGAYFAFGRLLHRPLSHNRSAWRHAGASLLFAAPLVILARGGLQSRPLTIGDSCISPNPYLNALCLNPVYSALFTSVAGERERFHFGDDATNICTVRGLLGIDAAAPLSDRHPLLRTSPGTAGGNRKNVVIFVLESWSGKDIGCLGGRPDATPAFDALARQGLLFTNFQATGIRTAEGMVSILCAFPNMPVLPVLKRHEAFQTHWRAISQILAETGYTNIFIHGRDLDFDNVTDFLRLIHFDRIIDRRDFPPSVSPVSDAWPGYNDMDVMRRADEVFAAQGGKPFLGTIYLMNSHPPFMTPEDFPKLVKPTSNANKFLNSLHYTDAALGTFFDCARKQPYFKDTYFLFVADHARTGDKFTLSSKHHIPFLIYAPEMIKPGVRAAAAAQTDILPTVLGLLNLGARHASWGRDLLATPDERGFAVSVEGSEIRWRDQERLLNDSLSSQSPQLFDFKQDPKCENDVAAGQPQVAAELQKKLHAWLSLSQTMLDQNRIYP